MKAEYDNADEWILNMKNRHVRLSLGALLLTAALYLGSCGIIILNKPTPDNTETTQAPDAPGGAAPQPESTASTPQHADQSEYYGAFAAAYLRRITDNGYNYDGASFLIASPRTEVLQLSDADNAYSAALYKRNEDVEGALNIRLTCSAVDEESFFDQLHASTLADDYFADLLLVPEGKIGSFAAGGVLTNLKSMPLLDLSQPYFDAASIEAATACGVTYAAAGAASFEITSLPAVFFNRGLFEENGVEVPYPLVYEGKWTWDAFFASCASVAGINRYAAANGIEPFSSYATQYAAELLPSAAFFSCGGKFVRSDGSSSPSVCLSEEDSAIAAVITRLYQDEYAHKDTASGVARFHNGKSLYLLDRLYLMSWMPDSRQNWGILPLPKMTEDQEDYITLADDSVLFFAVQKGAIRPERTSVVLSALNAASYGVLTEAYVKYAMNHLLRDNDSANMLELIAFSRAYDFAMAFGRSNASLASATVVGMTELAGGTPFSAICARIPTANRQLAARYPAPGG